MERNKKLRDRETDPATKNSEARHDRTDERVGHLRQAVDTGEYIIDTDLLAAALVLHLKKEPS